MSRSSIQFGCGLCAPPRWRNFDASPTLRLQRVPVLGRFLRVPGHPTFPRNVEFGDIVAGLPVAPGSCDALYSSHVLEHLALRDLRTALANCLVILRPGATFRLVVPDLEALARGYLSRSDAGAASDFMEATHLGRTTRPRGVPALLRAWLGSDAHRWMWDYKGLAGELERAGFVNVRRATIGDAADPAFADVEDRGRWELAVGVDCQRPA